LADRIYWTGPADTISGAPLAGGGTVDTLYAAPHVAGPGGLAIDPVAGLIYWANIDGRIQRAPLAGGGTPDTLYGQLGAYEKGQVAINPVAGLIYWIDFVVHDATIQRAPLAGGGPVRTLYDWAQGVFAWTVGLSIDPAAGRIYWSNLFEGKIRGAPLAGGGPVDPLYGPAQGVNGPVAVAIDSAAQRIYWANRGDNTIRSAPLAGGGPVPLYGPAQGVNMPMALAIDPTPTGPARIEIGETERPVADGWLRKPLEWARNRFSRSSSSSGRIYWANSGDNTIRGAPLAGGGPVELLHQGVISPWALAVLRAPLPAGAPTISWSLMLPDDPFGGWRFGDGHSGPLNQRLSCSRGTWAPDLVGSFLHRAPQNFAYQWRLNGNDVGGATSAHYTPTTPGSYTCRVTAVNDAGTSAQVSAAVTVS
jgi:hypothetical protein